MQQEIRYERIGNIVITYDFNTKKVIDCNDMEAAIQQDLIYKPIDHPQYINWYLMPQ